MNGGQTAEAPERRKSSIVRVTLGWLLVISGGALLVLPGPGIPLLLAGLAVLAPHQPWAGRLQRSIRDRWARARARHQRNRTGSPTDGSAPSERS